MKTHKLMRDIHYWGAIISALPMVIIIVAGILLMLKKEFDWIQPSSARSTGAGVPTISVNQLFDAVVADGRLNVQEWQDLDRADIKPGKGIIKFSDNDGMEAQVDLHTGEVLKVAPRRSDVIEAIHDGSYFADWMKLYVFLPIGVFLLGLWITGLYLFIRTEYKKAQSRKSKRARLQAAE